MCYVCDFISSDTISRHKESLLAKSLSSTLMAIWDVASISSLPSLRPKVLVLESSSATVVDGDARLKIPITESISLILTLSDQGDKDDVIALSLFFLRQTLKHVPTHYCTSLIPVELVGEVKKEEEENTTEEVPSNLVGGLGDETFIYPALQTVIVPPTDTRDAAREDDVDAQAHKEVEPPKEVVPIDWVSFFANVTKRIGMLEKLDKLLDQIKGILSPLIFERKSKLRGQGKEHNEKNDQQGRNRIKHLPTRRHLQPRRQEFHCNMSD